MSINNNEGRTLSGIGASTESINIPSTIDAIRIGGDIGRLREVVGKDAITNKVKWLDITDTQIEDGSIIPRMIDSTANFTFGDVNCNNLSTSAVNISTTLTLPDLTATNEMVVSNAGVQVWSIKNDGVMKFIKDATAVPPTEYTRIEDGLITTEKLKATTEIRVNNRWYVDALGNLIFYNTDGTTELASVKQGVGVFTRIQSLGGITNAGTITQNGTTNLNGNITQVGDTFNSNGKLTLTKATTGSEYTFDITQGQANFGGDIKTESITTGITAEKGTINCYDLVASNRVSTTDITITGEFDFTGSLDLNSIEAHNLKIKTHETDEADDEDVFVVEGEVKEAPFYRQIKMYSGMELWDRTVVSGAVRRIQMDMVSGNIITTGGFTGNLFAFQTGSINGELLVGDITARNGVNGRFFVDVNMTADKGSVELIGDSYAQNIYITNNGRIIDASLDPPAEGQKLISLKQNGDILCENLTATTKVKADTIETNNFTYAGNIDLGDIKGRSLTIETDADVEKITLSSSTGTIKGIHSEAGNNHQLDRLDIHSSLSFQTNLLVKTLEMLQSTGQINQTGTGGIVQSVATSTLNVLQPTEINGNITIRGKASVSAQGIETGGQVKCEGIDSDDGGSIDGAEFQVNKGLVVQNPAPTTDPPTPEGYALTLNGKSLFNQEVDFIGSPVDFGSITDLINDDVVNIYGRDLDMFGSTIKLFKVQQAGTDVASDIRTFDNTSLPPVGTGTTLSAEGYVESRDFRPTKTIQYEYIESLGENQLFGASAVHKTKCKNLDLSDDTNVLPVNPVSLEFGIYYCPNPSVSIESDDDDWKYWGDNLFCVKPAYADSSLTTIEIDMTYNIRNDAFGDFLIGIAYSTDNGNNKYFISHSEQLCSLQSAPGIGSMRNQFVKRYQVILENQPYNQVRSYYPIFRTNTGNDGLIKVEHGGVYQGFNNPACVMRGRPYPSTFRIHRTLDYAGQLI